MKPGGRNEGSPRDSLAADFEKASQNRRYGRYEPAVRRHQDHAVVPPVLAGLLEIRGQGIVRRRFVSPARIHLVVDLLPLAECDRMPAPPAETVSIASIELPLLRLPIGLADGPVRVRAAVAERLLPRR